MKNWNTDTSGFKTAKSKRIWELSQLINYGLDGEKLSQAEIKTYWPALKKNLDKERARMMEFLIWGKQTSLTTRDRFWNLSPKTNI